MTTVVTNGFEIIADTRSVYVGKETECPCGESHDIVNDDVVKIVDLKKENIEWNIAGDKVLAYGIAGTLALRDQIGIIATGTDLKVFFKTITDLNTKRGLTVRTFTTGSVLFVTESHKVFYFGSEVLRPGLFNYEFYQKKDIGEDPDKWAGIGTGSSFFRTYRHIFDADGLDTFRYATRMDKHSCDDFYVCWSAEEGLSGIREYAEDETSFLKRMKRLFEVRGIER